MYCNYCRALNPNDAVYCSVCGRPISRTLNADATETEAVKGIGGITSARQNEQVSGAHINSENVAAALKNAALPSASELQSTAPPVIGDAGKLESSLSVPVYATMGSRFTAYFADLIVIYFLAMIFYGVAFAFKLSITGNEGESQVVWFAIFIVYMVVAQASYHTTIGKYVHGLEVCSANPKRKYPAFWRILVRETFGRLFSSFLWGLGYWMALRKPKVQAWSDELAGTVVTVRPTNKVLVRALTAFVLIALILDVGLTGYGFYKEDRGKKYAALQRDMEAASNEVVAARKAVDNRLNSALNSASTVNTWTDFSVWQEIMQSFKGDLDTYEIRIDRVQNLIQKGISEDLAASEAEKNDLVLLRQIYELRKQQAEKYRQEANMVVNCQKTQTAFSNLRNDLQLLDSDIKGLDSQASQLLSQLNTK